MISFLLAQLLFCPVCKVEHEKSIVTEDSITITTTEYRQPYWDEEGHFQPNLKPIDPCRYFNCSRGHTFKECPVQIKTEIK